MIEEVLITYKVQIQKRTHLKKIKYRSVPRVCPLGFRSLVSPVLVLIKVYLDPIYVLLSSLSMDN